MTEHKHLTREEALGYRGKPMDVAEWNEFRSTRLDGCEPCIRLILEVMAPSIEEKYKANPEQFARNVEECQKQLDTFERLQN